VRVIGHIAHQHLRLSVDLYQRLESMGSISPITIVAGYLHLFAAKVFLEFQFDGSLQSWQFGNLLRISVHLLVVRFVFYIRTHRGIKKGRLRIFESSVDWGKPAQLSQVRPLIR